MRAKFLVGLSLLGFAVPAFAQPNAGSLLNQQEQQQHKAPQQLPAPEAPPERPPLKKGGAAVVVKSINFSGATELVPEASLQKVVAYAIGKKLDFAGLETLARHVTDYLHAQGWFLASAYLPQQDVSTGKIEISIRAGYLEGANGKGSAYSFETLGKTPPRLKQSRLDAIAAPLLKPGAIAKKGNVERALLLMQDLPGIAVQARLRPGKNPDSTHLAIGVKEGPLVSASARLDNHGNTSTGNIEVNVSAQLNDPAHIGDQVTGELNKSAGMSLGRVGYNAPLGGHGLRVGANLSAMTYKVVEGLGKSTGLKGDSSSYGAMLSYPIVRSRQVNVYANAGYNQQRLTDTSNVGELDNKQVAIWSGTLSGSILDRLGGGGLSNWSLRFNSGNLDLSGNAANEAQDAAGYQTAGAYTTVNYSLSRLQKLPKAFTFYASFRGQSASKNLDSSAQFILGGPYGIQAYPVGEASGDSGWLAKLELRYDVPRNTKFGHWRITGFYDAGHITLHNDPKGLPISTATGDNSYGLAGWGMGVTLQEAGRYNVSLVWAGKVGKNPGRSITGKDADNHSDNSRLWLLATMNI